MPDYFKGLVDQWGRPIEKAVLTQEVAAPTITGVRSPLTGYPGDGLNPVRLASILREADHGDPVRYLELAQTVEERDLHYVGVLGTRRRSVSQLDITVEPASESAAHEKHAERVREWLKRDELADELFDMLDAIGKGFSFTEIGWDTSSGQWEPAKLEWRDPRWFRFERQNLARPLLLDEHGVETPLPAWKFIHPVVKAKSGIPLRSGLARIVAWAWMFKAFTNRDWAIFTQTYGQPMRIGKWGPNATEKDKATLYRAVANIAGDCAAIIPESMVIEFIESKSIGASSDLYEKRIDHLDRQVSKAVLGQTTTTDAVSGGHAVSQEHRQVQEDIERADARALAAVLNRDLVRPWVQLEFDDHGGQFPRLKIGREEETDVDLIVNSVTRLIPLGLEVGKNQMREIVGIGKPADDDELLTAPAATQENQAGEDGGRKPGRPQDRKAGREALHQEQAVGKLPDELIGEAGAELAMPAIETLVERVRGIVERAGSLEAAAAVLDRTLQNRGEAGQPAIGAELVTAMRQAMLVAWLSGNAAEADRGGD